MGEPFNVALDLYKHSASSVDSLWTIYSGVVLGLVGYILGSKAVPGRAKVGLGVGFFVFALSNAWALWHSQATCAAAVDAIHDLSGPNSPLKDVTSTLTASDPLWVVGFQMLLTVGTLATVYGAHIHEKRGDARGAPPT